MNPNFNSDPETGDEIPYSKNMKVHASNVWGKYVQNSGFKNLLVIAHSAGGGCVSNIMKVYPESFFGMVKQIAYTDSWIIERSELNKE